MRKSFSIVFSAVLLLIVSAQGTWAQKVKFYDLGHYQGGTWAEPRDINDSGVVVGYGDISSGYTRPIGVPVFGPHAGQWFDLGTLGGDRMDMEVMCMAIADTGMIVGHSAIKGGDIVHAFAWTPKSGMVDIGTLANLGPRYSGYNFSLAYGTNKAGTLIAGWSSTEFEGPEMLPVVWTPQVVWTSGRPITTWKIQKLDMGDLTSATGWLAMFANDSGQIIGTATNADGVQIAVLWNPLPRGGGWKIMQLPVPADYPSAEPFDINNRGEIVGDVATQDWSTYFPALWKPVEHSGKAYGLTVLPTLTGLLKGSADAEGINDLGDIVGGSLDAEGNYFASRWSTRNPHSVQLLLSVPGGWSWATKVNNNGVATGSYGNATVPENTVVWQLR
jgi:probable HAF family extracellular repeat protein